MADMAYCGPRGIPHSHFLGGADRWTPLDREKALVWADLQGRTHQTCGTRPEEWFDDDGQLVQAYAYQMRYCPGCEQAAKARKGSEDGDYLHVTRT